MDFGPPISERIENIFSRYYTERALEKVEAIKTIADVCIDRLEKLEKRYIPKAA